MQKRFLVFALGSSHLKEFKKNMLTIYLVRVHESTAKWYEFLSCKDVTKTSIRSQSSKMRECTKI